MDEVRARLYPKADKGTADNEAGVDPLQDSITAAQQAIASATGPVRRTLETAWSKEIDNARSGDEGAIKRLVETWGAVKAGDDRNREQRPKLRVVNAG